MFNFFILPLAFVVVLASLDDDVKNCYNGVHNELPCLSFGGECRKHCPKKNQLALKGLCPKQQKNDVECCEIVKQKPGKCKSKGGECISKDSQCPETLLFKKAIDCKTEEKCCIFVN